MNHRFPTARRLVNIRRISLPRKMKCILKRGPHYILSFFQERVGSQVPFAILNVSVYLLDSDLERSDKTLPLLR